MKVLGAVQLSGGMRQRVALMRTFMFEREIMLLDEPFGALDALIRAMMQRWLLEVWEGQRRTVLFITHDIEEAIILGDRVLVMSARPGCIKLDLKVELPRPRRPDVITEPEFVAMKRSLLAAVEDESVKTFRTMNAEALPRRRGDRSGSPNQTRNRCAVAPENPEQF